MPKRNTKSLSRKQPAKKGIPPKKQPAKKRLLRFIIVFFAILLVLFMVILLIPEDEGQSQSGIDRPHKAQVDRSNDRLEGFEDLLPSSAPTVEIVQDPELLALLKSLGATFIQNLQIRYVDTYSDGGDTHGEYEDFYMEDDESEYFDHGVMTILKGLEIEELKRTVAHEYLHHVWASKMTEEHQNTLATHLNAMYASDGYMQQYEEQYKGDGGMIPTELFSFYCTETSDAKLVEYVLKQCNRFIDRSALVMLN